MTMPPCKMSLTVDFRSWRVLTSFLALTTIIWNFKIYTNDIALLVNIHAKMVSSTLLSTPLCMLPWNLFDTYLFYYYLPRIKNFTPYVWIRARFQTHFTIYCSLLMNVYISSGLILAPMMSCEGRTRARHTCTLLKVWYIWWFCLTNL